MMFELERKKKKKSHRPPLGSVGSAAKGNDGLLGEEKFINTVMRIRYVNPTEIKINPLNKKYFSPLPPNEYEILKKDIEERGIQDPLQVKPDYTLLAGENRLKIALELGITSVPFVYKDVENEKEEIKFIIADNLLRRQLTVDEKKELIKTMYGDEIIQHGKKGGDKSSQKAKENKAEPFTKKVSRETGIGLKTTERYLSEIRKEEKGKEQKQAAFLSPFDRLEKQLRNLKKNIEKIELKKEERKKVRAILQNIAKQL